MSKRTWTVPGSVVEVHDGDTVVIDLDLGWRIGFRVGCRISGIDAPELSTPEGVIARDYARGILLPGTEVTFVSRSLDKYGRPLGTILYKDSEGIMRDFALEMRKAGHAKPYDGGKRE